MEASVHWRALPVLALELDETRPLTDFLRMERGGERIEHGRRIRVFWNEEGRCFELDVRGHRWREVPGIGGPLPFDIGWRPLQAEAG